MNEKSANKTDSYKRNENICYYHPNAKGTGCAVRVELRMNRAPGDRYNCFFLEMARQKSVAGRTPEGRQPATFDWGSKITVKLDFTDVCEFLTVLDGRAMEAGGKRGGLYHAAGNSNTLIGFQRNAENGTYSLRLSKKNGGEETARKLGITLSEAEATGLRTIFQMGLFFITFHASLFDRGPVLDARSNGTIQSALR